MKGPTQNLWPIVPAVLTFIGYKHQDRKQSVYVVNDVLLKVRPPNCISQGTTSPLSKSTRTQPPWL